MMIAAFIKHHRVATKHYAIISRHKLFHLIPHQSNEETIPAILFTDQKIESGD